jgi:hypothetical protein
MTWSELIDMTPPIYVEEVRNDKNSGPTAEELIYPLNDRLDRVESEIGHLRDTLGRFGELVLRELKRLHPEPEPTPAPPVPEPKPRSPKKQNAQLALPAPVQNILDQLPIPIAIPKLRLEGWIIIDLARELKAMFGMFFDPRYTVRRMTQLTLIGIGLLLIGNYLFWSMVPIAIPFFSHWVEILIHFVIILSLYQLLQRELQRYREHLHHYTSFERSPSNQRNVVFNDEDPHRNMDIEE